MFVSWLYNWQLPWRMDMASFPDSFTIFKQTMVSMFFEDLCFYTMHRLSHTKHKYFPMYQYVHKMHHEYTYSVSIANQYAHPVEHVLSNGTSALLGGYVMGNSMHMSSLMIWGLVRTLESHDGHSGYDFPWSPFRLVPFGTDATYHDYHHSKNVGNFSSTMTIWDTVFNTNQDFYIEQTKKKCNEENNLKQD